MRKVKHLFVTLILNLILVSIFSITSHANVYPQYQTIDGITTVRCTYYAWQQAYENTGVSLPNFGDAKNWYSSAQNAGYATGTVAKAKSIAVWSGGTYGHVSYVVSVNGSKMTVNEGGMLNSSGGAYNGTGICNGNVVNSVVGQQKGNGSTKILVGFIYLTEGISSNVSIESASNKNTITDTNAILWGKVTKSAASVVTKNGIIVRKSDSTYTTGWSKYEIPSRDYSGHTEMFIYYNMNEELGITLTHAAQYCYKFYTVIDGKEYYSDEFTFTTTGSHSFGSWTTTTSATCSTGGIQTRKCSGCSTTETQTIPALGHNYSTSWTIDTAATCTTAGSKSHHCSRCGAKNDVTIISANGHAYGQWTTTTPTTCTTAGSKKRICTTCGISDTQTISALGHNYSTSWTIDTAPTCTTVGSKSHHCTRCEIKNDVTVISATGHSYAQWITTKNATCTNLGSKKRSCSICGNTETKSIPALGHSYSTSWTTDSTATCTTSGIKSHHCMRCDARSDITTISSFGHSWSDWIITVIATEENSGTKIRTCKNIGCNSTESAVIAKLPPMGHTHSFGEWYIEKPSTCTSDGLSKRKCTGCDAYETSTLSVTGHVYGEWTEKQQATTETEGIMERACKNCNLKENQSIPKLPQIVTESPETATPTPNTGEATPTPSLNVIKPETNTSSTFDTSAKEQFQNTKDSNITKIALIIVSVIAVSLLVTLTIIIKRKK